MNQLQHKYIIHLHNNLLQVRISKRIEEQRYTWVASRHCNAEYELHILLKGRIPVEVEENHFLLESRQGILILPGRYHAPLESIGELEHFSLSFTILDGELSERLHAKITNAKLFSISTEMLQECLAIYNECNINSAYRNEKIHSLLTSLIISVLRNMELHPSTTPILSSTELERTEIIDNFFDEQLKDHVGSEQLAKQLHLSERQLNRVLYRLYGMTFQEKMTRTKMDRAAWLLRTTDKKISEIAEAIGYSSEGAFYQAFRKHFQITPYKYRINKKLF